jgi:hypothetical protein
MLLMNAQRKSGEKMNKVKITALLAVLMLTVSALFIGLPVRSQQYSGSGTNHAGSSRCYSDGISNRDEHSHRDCHSYPHCRSNLRACYLWPTNFPSDVDPLTGLTVSDPTILDRRPVMIKVSNYPRSTRPHAGLSSADIVFDYYIGEGGNRFLALFYGQNTDAAGPIRSGRLVDRWLVRMYQGILGLEYAYAPVYTKILDQLGYSRMVSGTDNTCRQFAPTTILWLKTAGLPIPPK